MKRAALAVVLVCSAGIAAASGFDVLGRIERAMLYPFDGSIAAPPAGVTEAVWERDGEELVLWLAEPRSGQPVIVYFQGNAGNLGNRAARFDIFVEAGFGLIALSPRSAGGSTGTPSEAALTQDASALLQDVAAWIPSAAPSRVIVYGESLGTAVAIAALSQDETRAAGLILEAPFASIPEIARASGLIPDSLVPRIQDRWPSLERAAQLTLPLLVLHGTEDDVVPFAQGQSVFSAAPSRTKDFIRVSGAGHSDLWRSDVVRRILRFARDQSAR